MARSLALVPVLLVCATIPLASCGQEEATPRDVTPEPGRPTAEDLLSALADRVARGDGISDATWTGEVQEVAMALWPDEQDPAAQASRGRHTTLAHIAGDMARKIGSDELGVRAEWEQRDPSSVRIYDAFVQASKLGADAYRVWVDGGGEALLRERIQAIQGDGPPPR